MILLEEPGASPLKVSDSCQFAPLSILYSNVPLPVAFTTIVPVRTEQVGCVTVGAVIVGTGAAVKTTGLLL